MAGSALVVTMSNPYGDMAGPNKVILDWTSDSTAGTVSIPICSTYAAAQGWNGVQPAKLQGFIRSLETIPGASGDLTTTLPTAAYDVTLLDSYAQDVSAAVLADRSGTVAEREIPTSPLYIDDEITLTIANAGNSKTGRLILELVGNSGQI